MKINSLLNFAVNFELELKILKELQSSKTPENLVEKIALEIALNGTIINSEQKSTQEDNNRKVIKNSESETKTDKKTKEDAVKSQQKNTKKKLIPIYNNKNLKGTKQNLFNIIDKTTQTSKQLS